jgi:hypothetical protein
VLNCHWSQPAALLDSAGAEFIEPSLAAFCCRSVLGSDEVATVVSASASTRSPESTKAPALASENASGGEEVRWRRTGEPGIVIAQVGAVVSTD